MLRISDLRGSLLLTARNWDTFNVNFVFQNTAMLNENVQQIGGGLNELNSILNTTQTKINRLKVISGQFIVILNSDINLMDGLSWKIFSKVQRFFYVINNLF